MYIGEEKVSKIHFDTVVNIIDDCIHIASDNNGAVFGGYLRDVLLPRLNNKPLNGFKDVDLWFMKQSDASLFVLQMKDKYDFKYDFKLFNTVNNVYPFKKSTYHLFKYDNIMARFDIIISDTLPVDDLSINLYTFTYKDNKPVIDSYVYSPTFNKPIICGTKDIMTMVYCNCKLLPSYFDKLMTKSPVYLNRLNNRFLSKGYKITYQNTLLPYPLTLNWLKENFNNVNNHVINHNGILDIVKKHQGLEKTQKLVDYLHHKYNHDQWVNFLQDNRDIEDRITMSLINLEI
ncbi:MAG TPA: hypothetical protein VLG50_05700 [Candidatus Saccharimonadales bacterium]|nr:hypothetical protein [Candidatus Saccharimonadales bacterium]